jgi:RNA polymerase sigma-70 factor (ECF subfamily)
LENVKRICLSRQNRSCKYTSTANNTLHGRPGADTGRGWFRPAVRAYRAFVLQKTAKQSTEKNAGCYFLHVLCDVFEMTHAQTITLYQPLLHTIAYNLVRCRHDAEDIVQETFLRWLTIDQQTVQNTKAYLIKAVTNNCLSHLQTLKRKKQEYLDAARLPDVIGRWKVEINTGHLDLDVRLQQALRIVQHKLEPLERAAFLLKEVFDFEYDELQQALNKKADHCRQLISRARKKISQETQNINFEWPAAGAFFKTFQEACRRGEPTPLLEEIQAQR